MSTELPRDPKTGLLIRRRPALGAAGREANVDSARGSAAPSRVATERHTYEIGYGKPPVSGRFQEGISGNPGGRPPREKRQPKSGEEFVVELLEAKLPVRTLRGAKKMRRIEYWLSQWAAKGDKGDFRAVEKLLAFVKRYPAQEKLPQQQPEQDMSAAEGDILEQYRRQCIEEHIKLEGKTK